jgi:hypothetical protein
MSESYVDRRSLGRVRTVVHHSSIAWVKDFRPMEKDVLIRLRNPWQARPGELLDYKLESSQAPKGRMQGVDVIFNREPDLAEIFALDDGNGLSEEGLRFLMRAVIADPICIKQLFSGQTSTPLKKQLLELEELPLPRALVLKALQHQDFASSALARLLSLKTWDRESFEVALEASASFEQDVRLINDVREKSPEILTADLAFPEFKREARIWMLVDNLDLWNLVFHLPQVEIPDVLALRFLEQAWFSVEASEKERSIFNGLTSDVRCAMYKAAFLDPRRSSLEKDPFVGLEKDADFQSVMQSLFEDEKVGDEARKRLGSGSIEDPQVALRMLKNGLSDEMKRPAVEGLIKTQLDGDACTLLGETIVMDLATYSQNLSDREFALRLQAWLGRCPGVVGSIDAWLMTDDRRELALGCLCAAVDFPRGLVQRILPLEMPEDLRHQLAVSISGASPERWQDRYILNDKEKALWLEAGAPLL